MRGKGRKRRTGKDRNSKERWGPPRPLLHSISEIGASGHFVGQKTAQQMHKIASRSCPKLGVCYKGRGRTKGKERKGKEWKGEKMIGSEIYIHTLCYAIVLPGRKSGFRTGFGPDSSRKTYNSALRPILRLSLTESGRNPARKPDFRPASTIA